MKILMVNKFLYPNGGSETYVFKIGEYLQSIGHEVEYFGMEHEGRCVGNSAEQYTKDMDFHGSSLFSKLTYPIKTIYSKEAYEKIGIVLDHFKPDVVHLNNINFQLTPSIIYAIKKRGIPIVQTVHDCQIACPNHRMYIDCKQAVCAKCLNGDYTNCIKERCVHNSLVKSIIATIESKYYHTKKTYDLIDKYISPSQYMADIIEKGGINPKKIEVLYNFSERPNTDLTKSKEKKYAIYFGRLSVEKGIKTLIAACKELPNIQFVFAGSGPLEEECSSISNINFVGFKTGDELKTLIKNAAFSIVASECYENCPMSIIESQMLGTPVVGSNLGGIPELIENGKTGIIFEAGNVPELIDKILYIYNNEPLLEKMSKNCISSNINTIDIYADKLIKIYKSITE